MSVRPAVAVPACEAAVQKYPNDARLKFQLGRAYQKANNFIAAVAQYQKSATQQYAPAQNNLGFMYENGLGVPKDLRQANAWVRKAAENGDQTAQFGLGVVFAVSIFAPMNVTDQPQYSPQFDDPVHER